MKLTALSPVLGLIALCWAASATAEVHIQIHEVPLDELVRPQVDVVAAPAGLSSSTPESEAKVERPSTFLILAHFKIDSTNPFGETTFVTIRNEADIAQDLTFNLYDVDSIGARDSISFTAVAPGEVVPINLAAHATGVPGTDGFIRGWGRIIASSPISVDFFQVNTSQDFAAAGTLIDIRQDEYCYITRSRFLIGGGFSGGTQITLMQDLPLGGDVGTDPPSIEGEVFDEAGTFINSFAITTDNYSLQLEAEDLVLPGTTAGVIEFVFKNAEDGLLGGFSSSELKANNKFSVNLKGFCKQQVPSS